MFEPNERYSGGVQAMMYPIRLVLFVGFVSLGVTGTVRSFHSSAHQSGFHPEQKVSATQAFRRLPMSFEPNRGQFDPGVMFGSEHPSYSIFLKSTGATLKMRNPGERHAATLQMSFQLANEHSQLRGLEPAPGVTNYYYGNQESWIANVPTYERVIAEDVYPGIDVVYYGNQQHLEYDFVVKPRASAQVIDIAFDNAGKIAVENSGDLIVSLGDRDVRLSPPVMYQNKDRQRAAVEGRYVVTPDRHVRFSVGKYDHSEPLIIDPQVVFSAYGDGAFAYGNAIDSSGNVYICGAAEKSQGASIAFVDKFNSGGTALVYHNRFGSGDMLSSDVAFAMAVDASGNVYVTGHTEGGSPFTRFPTVNPIQAAGFNDAFVTKFDASGAMVYSTLLGGSGSIGEGDTGTGIAVDHMGNIYVTGKTQSTDFPTYKPFQAALSGTANNPDAFLSVLNPQGSAFIYSTYIGGTNSDSATGIAVDSSGNAYVSGTTNSTDFPASSALSPHHGNFDGFVLKFNAAGSALRYSVLLGGSADDAANGIALDSSGNAYVAGTTYSTNFPTMGAFQSALSGSSDAFLAKLNSTGTALVYATYLGGSKNENGAAVAVNGVNAYVVGQTFSADFPQVRSLQGFTADSDAFIARFSADGSTPTYSTLLGGSVGCCHLPPASTYAAARSIAGDGATTVVVAGDTNSSDFPTTVTPVGTCCGGTSGFNSEASFVAKLVDDQVSTTWTRVEQNSAAVQFNGDWLVNSNPNDSGGTARLTLVNSATFTFSGTAARWVGFSDPWSGMANVYVDGTLKASVDTYSATTKYQVVQYTITGLPSGTHTLKVQATGQHDTQSQSSWVWVDAFDYMAGPITTGNPDFSLSVTPNSTAVNQGTSKTFTVSILPANGFNGTVGLSVSGLGSGATPTFNPTSITGSGSSILTIMTTAAAQTGAFTFTITGASNGLIHSVPATLTVNTAPGSPTWNRVEEGSTAVQFIGDWFMNSNPNHTGGSAYLTLVNSVVFTFSGTGARWVGFSDPWSGIANVYVDGVLKATVDTYSATTRYQVLQYTITGLPPGSHTLRIVAAGQHDSAAAASWVWVDAFDYAN